MILFLYGEDTYRLNQKVKALKERFINASLGDTNLSILDGTAVSYADFARQVLALPFLAKSRLVIVNSPANNKQLMADDKFIELLSKVPETTVLVMTEEGNPDRRTKLFKLLNKPKISQDFPLLEPDQLARWVRAEVEKKGGQIDRAATLKLIEYVGSDLWRMQNEIDKLVTHDQIITEDAIELLVTSQIHSNIFNLMDAVGQKNLRAAEKELSRLIAEGKAEPYILSMIVMEYRNLLIIKDILEKSPTQDRWGLAKKAGLHPFVAQKTAAMARNYTMAELKKIYRLLLDFDWKIKTGKIESRVALELLIFKLTKK